MTRSAFSRPLAFTLVAFVLLIAWDSTSLDLVLARMAGTPAGFPLRNDWFLVKVMHEGAKSLSWLLVVGLFAGIRWPVGILRLLPTRERVQLALTVLASVLVVSLIKRSSATSCPWDLQAFGGVARYVSHWSFGVRDGGGGECFPAGHASAAFAYAGGYFAFRRAAPRVAGIWLGVALAAGLALGVGQQLRGAHFMSHTFWTAWICWTTGLVIDALARWLPRLRGAPPLQVRRSN
jgi:membrane-associated PAP2 superfamily phosphatase